MNTVSSATSSGIRSAALEIATATSAASVTSGGMKIAMIASTIPARPTDSIARR